jgi:hypothetical protein
MPSDPTPKRSGSVIRRLVLPIVVLVAIVAASSRALDSAALPSWPLLRSRSGLPTWQLCQMSKIRSGAPASDLLVMGSSRTAAAMDVAWMNRAGSDLRAERVVFTFGAELDRNLAYRTYVQERGVPKVLGLEISFTRSRAKRQANPLQATSRTRLMFQPQPYWDLVGSLRDDQDVPTSDTYFWSRLQSTAGFSLGRIDGGLDLALRDPPAAIRPRATCTRNRAGFFDNIGTAREPVDLEPLAERRSQIWSRLVNGQGPVDLTSDVTSDETKLLRNLVDTARRDGVEQVFLYYLPGFDEAADTIDLTAIARLFRDTQIFDAREILNDPSQPLLREQYGSASHVNRKGAYAVSQAFLNAVEEARP